VSKPRANVYVDGLNLYRRALAGTPYKWLDLERMASLLLHDFEIQQIRYFTALLRHVPHDPAGPQRQQIYLRALRTNPKIVIHLGDFRADVRYMPLHPWQYDESGRPVTARVRKTEEKGSDVNLATHLILDAIRDSADVYVVVSNDSDLVEPIRIIVSELDQVVGLILPTQTPSRALLDTGAQIIHHLRAGVLQAAQLSETLVDVKGSFRKPEGW
jgi:uncharacterized LabA/DUF88 family protein